MYSRAGFYKLLTVQMRGGVRTRFDTIRYGTELRQAWMKSRVVGLEAKQNCACDNGRRFYGIVRYNRYRLEKLHGRIKLGVKGRV